MNRNLVLVSLFVAIASTACGGSGGGDDDDNNGGDPDNVVFSGGSIDDLKGLSSSLTFKNLTIDGPLSLPVFSSETITVDNLEVTPAGSIGYSYSTCQYVDAPSLTIDASGSVSIEGMIHLNGRSGTSVTSGASCNSCYGQDGGDVTITADSIVIASDLWNYGGSGATYRDIFGSSGCSGGDSGNTQLLANTVDLSGADLETRAGRGGAEGFGYGPSGATGTVEISAAGEFVMNPGSISTNGALVFQAGTTDIVGPIVYNTLNSSIGGGGDATPPTGQILAPAFGDSVDLNQPLELQVSASDVGLGVREIDVAGFGYSATHSAAGMVNGVLTVQIPGPVTDNAIQVTVRDNMMLETALSVGGLSVAYAAEAEPNDSAASAQPLNLPVAIEGSISPSDAGTCDPTLASYVADSNCLYHTAQDFYTFSVPAGGDYLIEVEFAGNGADTDLDIFLDYSAQGSGWWTWSNGDNATSGNYVETLDVNLWTMETFTLAVQAWPSWVGSADYRLIIRAAP